MAPFVLAALTVCLIAKPAAAEPLFARVPGAFGAQPCVDATSGSGCYTNYALITDLEPDGHADVLFPNSDGYFRRGVAQPFVTYRSQDGALSNTTSLFDRTGFVRQVAVGDIDGDGDLDVYAPSAWSDLDALFVQTNGTFVNEGGERLGRRRSSAGAARFGDMDGDGDLDIVVTEGWAQSTAHSVIVLENDGAGHFTEMTATARLTSGVGPVDLDLFDADGDFDLDVLVTLHEGTSALLVNDGAGAFEARALPRQANKKYGPAVCDVDGDGDLDIIADNARADQTEQLLINDGGGSFTDETEARISGNAKADDNAVACVDFDGDGDFDLIVASLDRTERLLSNDGTGHFALVADAFAPFVDSTLGIDVGDVDGDGRLDIVTGQGESGSYENQFYRGSDRIPVDTRAPQVRAVSAPRSDQASVSLRFAVVDSVATDVGPRLRRAYLKAGERELEAHFVGGDLFQVTLPAELSARGFDYEPCAIDAAGNAVCGTSAHYGPATPPAATTPGSPTSASAADGGCALSARPAAAPTPSTGGLTASAFLIALAYTRRRRSRSHDR